MVHDINTLKFQELMKILKNTEIKLKLNEKVRKLKPQMLEERDYLSKALMTIPLLKKANLKTMMMRMLVLLQEDFSNQEGRNLQ